MSKANTGHVWEQGQRAPWECLALRAWDGFGLQAEFLSIPLNPPLPAPPLLASGHPTRGPAFLPDFCPDQGPNSPSSLQTYPRFICSSGKKKSTYFLWKTVMKILLCFLLQRRILKLREIIRNIRRFSKVPGHRAERDCRGHWVQPLPYSRISATSRNITLKQGQDVPPTSVSVC